MYRINGRERKCRKKKKRGGVKAREYKNENKMMTDKKKKQGKNEQHKKANVCMYRHVWM